jgi:hypothetical protein
MNQFVKGGSPFTTGEIVLFNQMITRNPAAEATGFY